jgi:hypothetical protein
MAQPMVMDGGIEGLEQSLHHPLAGHSQFNPTAPKSPKLTEKVLEPGETEAIISRIKAYAAPDKQVKVAHLCDLLVASTRPSSSSLPPSPLTDEDPVTIKQLRAILKETLLLTAATAATRSYAAVASKGTTSESYQVIPERRTREIRVHAPNQAPELAQRNATQVVDAIKAATGSRAVEARQLPSGDTIVTFQKAIPL